MEEQQLDQGMTDMSDKDPEMGALLSKLHGSISGRHIDIRKVKVGSLWVFVSVDRDRCNLATS